jgi:hypothetical protein
VVRHYGSWIDEAAHEPLRTKGGRLCVPRLARRQLRPGPGRIEAESLKVIDEKYQQDTDPAFRTRALIDRRGVVPNLVTVRAPERTPDRPCAGCLDHSLAAERTGPAVRGRVAFWLVALI